MAVKGGKRTGAGRKRTLSLLRRLRIGMEYSNRMDAATESAALRKAHLLIQSKTRLAPDNDVDDGLVTLHRIRPDLVVQGRLARQLIVDAMQGGLDLDAETLPLQLENAVLNAKARAAALRQLKGRRLPLRIWPAHGHRNRIQNEIAQEFGVSARMVARCYAEWRRFERSVED